MSNDLCYRPQLHNWLPIYSDFYLFGVITQSKITTGLNLWYLALKFYFSINLILLSVTNTGKKKSPT